MASLRDALPLLGLGMVVFFAGLFVGEGIRSSAPAPPPSHESESRPGEPQKAAIPDPRTERTKDELTSKDVPSERGNPSFPSERAVASFDWREGALRLATPPEDWGALLAGVAGSDLPPHVKAAAIRKVGIREKVGEVVPPSQIDSMGLVRSSYLGEIQGTKKGRLVDSAGWAQLLASENSLTTQDWEALESKLWEFEEELTLNEKQILQVAFEVAQQKNLNGAMPAALAYFRLDGRLILVEKSDDPRLSELADSREAVTKRRAEWLGAFLRSRTR